MKPNEILKIQIGDKNFPMIEVTVNYQNIIHWIVALGVISIITIWACLFG